MNIYCLIFMCTFGANSTDTEMPTGAIGERTGETPADVASMILPDKGEPVPKFGDVVMELPQDRVVHITEAAPNQADTPSYTPDGSSQNSRNGSDTLTPSLSDILLPPGSLQSPPFSN